MKGKPSGRARERLYHNIAGGQMTCTTAGQHIVHKHTPICLLKQCSQVWFPHTFSVEVKVACFCRYAVMQDPGSDGQRLNKPLRAGSQRGFGVLCVGRT